MRFADFLKSTVLLCAGAATALGLVAVLSASDHQADPRLTGFLVGWWALATMIGGWLGRRSDTNPPIARLLATSRAATSIPELQPSRLLINRLWPLVVTTCGGISLGFLAPQIPGIAAGFAVIWALAWRRQHGAVTAIEHRDGVEFYIEPTGPGTPMRLVRVPGMRRDLSGLGHPNGTV